MRKVLIIFSVFCILTGIVGTIYIFYLQLNIRKVTSGVEKHVDCIYKCVKEYTAGKDKIDPADYNKCNVRCPVYTEK